MANKKRALFGGSFDPIHFGHLMPVIDAAETLGIEQVTYIPCFQQPLKDHANISAEHRLTMCQLAIQSDEVTNALSSPLQLSVDDYEIAQQGKSYTVHTLRHFKTKLVDTDLVFFVGQDSLLNLNKWYKWRDILNMATLAVMTRPGYDVSKTNLPVEIQQMIGNEIILINNVETEVSSTEIRQLLSNPVPDERLTTLLPKAVWHYIHRHGLYRT